MKKSYFLSSLLAAMFVSMPMSADVIGMRTNAAMGEKLSLALNENVKATLTWANGATEELSFTGKELEITVKDAAFTLSSDQQLTRLFCPDCSLTELDLDEAPNLISLICPGNQLTKLNLSKSKSLVELNCEDNQIAEIVQMYKATDLKHLNVSNNKLSSSSLSVGSLKALKTLLCANNGLTTLSLANLDDLTTLWCQGNKLTELTLPLDGKLQQLCVFDNEVAELESSCLANIKELWADNNKLSSLDLAATHIEILSASDNELTSILWNENDDEHLKAFYVDGNQLMFNSMPTVFDYSKRDTVISYNVDNQKPFVVAETIGMNEQLDFGKYTRKNAWGVFTQVKPVFKDAEGAELVKGEDYKYLSGKCTFFKPYSAVNISMTSRLFPDVEFCFAPFKVVDPTGIEKMDSDHLLQISVTGNQLCVSSLNPVTVKVYTVSGALVVNEHMVAGVSSWTLPAGVYVVNGQKVVLGR